MTVTAVPSFLELAQAAASPPATAATGESSAPPTGTAEPTSQPTPPRYLSLRCELPDGYRLVSLHLMYDDTWTVCIGTLPRVLDPTGASMGYSDYYGSGRHADVNVACEQAIAMIDYRRSNQIPLKRQIAATPSPTSSKRTSGLSVPLLNLDELDIKL